MQHTEKSIIQEIKSPCKEHLITCRISLNEYYLICRLKKIKKLNLSQAIRYAISKLREDAHKK